MGLDFSRFLAPRLQGVAASPLTAAGLIAARERLGLLGLAAGGFLTLGALTLTVFSRAEEARAPVVFVVDAAGVVHSGPGARLSLESELFRRLAIAAARTALSRSCREDGAVFDDYEELGLLFNDEGRRAVEADLAVQMRDFAVRKISQKVHVERVRAVRERAGRRFVAVLGRLERSGQFEGRPFRELLPYTAVLAFVPNPRLEQTGAYPFVVGDVKIALGAESPENP
ncbi:MAG: hypothetical protein JSR82_00160 [Verrucomicrobia bacterium]|nr:hypothetical protein [Verrucomicrobiota bacterium]